MTAEEIRERADALRAIMLDTAAQQFQELQAVKAELVIARTTIADLQRQLDEDHCTIQSLTDGPR